MLAKPIGATSGCRAHLLGSLLELTGICMDNISEWDALKIIKSILTAGLLDKVEDLLREGLAGHRPSCEWVSKNYRVSLLCLDSPAL